MCRFLLSQAFSPWYFSWTSGDSHHTRCELHTAVLSVLFLMFLVQLSFVVNLLNVFVVRLPNFSLKFVIIPLSPIIIGIIIHFMSHIRCINIRKQLRYLNFSCFMSIISVCRYYHVYRYARFLSFLFLIIISGPFDANSLFLVRESIILWHHYVPTVVCACVCVCVCVCSCLHAPFVVLMLSVLHTE